MARETEIKLRVGSVAEFRKKLKRVGARTVAADPLEQTQTLGLALFQIAVEEVVKDAGHPGLGVAPRPMQFP